MNKEDIAFHRKMIERRREVFASPWDKDHALNCWSRCLDALKTANERIETMEAEIKEAIGILGMDTGE